MDPRLSAYLARLGLSTPPAPDAAGLARLQQAHRQAIAFENLDIPLARGIAVDSESVFAKLVAKRRGGYCFEQNRLFADMLALLGLATRPLLARVLLGPPSPEPPPRTHVLLLAEVAGEAWILDAGFGGSYVPPLRLAEGAGIATADGARHRLVKTGTPGSLAGEWRLDRAGPQGATDGRALDHVDWQPQYGFDLGEVAPADLVQANHWTATHPSSRFTQLCVASIALPTGFAALTDRILSVTEGGESRREELADAASWGTAMRATFGIELSEDDVARLPLF